MELAVSVTIRELVIHLHCVSEYEAPGYAAVSLYESLIGVPNNKLRTKLWLSAKK